MMICVLFSSCRDGSIHTYEQEEKDLKSTIQVLKEQIQLQNEKIQELEGQIQKQNEKMSELEADLLEYKEPMTINYISYKDKRRFVEKETDILSLPRDRSLSLRIMFPNTVVEVLAAGTQDFREIWLYVLVPTLDSPSNNRGWVRESDTVPYTEEVQKLVQEPICIKIGADIYEGYDYDQALSTDPVVLDYELQGRIEQRRDGYAQILCPGGNVCWVKEDDMIFPPVEG